MMTQLEPQGPKKRKKWEERKGMGFRVWGWWVVMGGLVLAVGGTVAPAGG